jgi:uncharacterized protein (TIGR01777 family)
MIGVWLAHALRSRGDEVLIITRRKEESEGDVHWNPEKGIDGLSRLEGIDTVVHLAGAPIADRPWTHSRRKILRSSRIASAHVLQDALSRLSAPPTLYVGAGGLGRFGDRGDDIIDDDADPGSGFLADLATDWEAAHFKAVDLGCRVAVLRMSIVLSPTGGAFPLMVKPFRLGIGGWLGNGRQYTSWISVRDAVGALLFLLDNPACSGSYNGCTPEPCRNKAWFKALGRALNRPVLTHAPKWALRGALGDLADDLFLASLRPVPRKLLQAGYSFQDPDIEQTFRWMIEEMDRGGPAMAHMPRPTRGWR